MWNLEKKHGKLSAVQGEVRNAINRGGERLNTRNGLFWSKRTDYYGNYNGVTDGEAEGVHDEVDYLVRKKHGSLPPPDLYPVALRVILKKFPTEAE